MGIISLQKFKELKFGTIVGLVNDKKDKYPFVYGIKIDNTHILEVTPVYSENKILINATGSRRNVSSFILAKCKQIPDEIFKKRI